VPSVGRVVKPEQFYQKDISSNRLLVRRWFILGCYKRTFVVSERSIPFNLFYRVYFASEKHVTRTSKTPYSWKAVNEEMERKQRRGLIRMAEIRKDKEGGNENPLHVRDVNLMFGWAIFHLREKYGRNLKRMWPMRRQKN
jgi:hypothetical protein